MRKKKNKVYLMMDQRKELVRVIKARTHSAEKMRGAQILLLLDENNAPQLAMKFTTMGLTAIERKKRLEPPIKPIVTGEVEAPVGHNKWTLSLTAEKLVELNIAPTISRDIVSRVLKKRIETSPE